jgi:hypothetical protein
MKAVRYSTPSLWLKYLNRDSSIIGLVAAAVFCLFCGLFLMMLGRQLAFVVTSEAVQATVLGKRQARLAVDGPRVASLGILAHGGRKGPKYLVQYEFADAAGNRHQGERAASFEVWSRVQPGDTIPVRYDPANPGNSQIDEGIWSLLPAFALAALGLLLPVAIIACGVSRLRWIHRQIRLVRHGDAVPGRITAAGIETRGKRRTTRVTVLQYEFRAACLEQHSLELQGALRPNWKAGLPLVVLVDPEKPAEHAPDLFDARSDDRALLFGSA